MSSLDLEAEDFVIRTNGPDHKERKYIRALSTTLDEPIWTECQLCALRFTRKVAHSLHQTVPSWTVVRIKPRLRRG